MDKENKEDLEFMRLLNKHPNIRARFESLLMIAEADQSYGDRADDIEMELRKEVTKIGQETLENWAIVKERQKAREMSDDSSVKKHGKKKFTGTQPLE